MGFCYNKNGGELIARIRATENVRKETSTRKNGYSYDPPPKGSKERWRAAASAKGVSLQRFIIDAVDNVVESLMKNEISNTEID